MLRCFVNPPESCCREHFFRRIDAEISFNSLKISLVFLLLRILFNIFVSTSRT
nr:MAG TPA: hypothetical protein [Caudoviricetes sp.]